MTSTDRGEAQPLRPTKQRTAVVEALAAFVYRTLQKLSEVGEVDMLRTEDGEAIYRRCSATHHHHLVCRSCGATVEVEGPTVERWTRAIAAEHGYADISHTLEIFGTCRSCG